MIDSPPENDKDFEMFALPYSHHGVQASRRGHQFAGILPDWWMRKLLDGGGPEEEGRRAA